MISVLVPVSSFAQQPAPYESDPAFIKQRAEAMRLSLGSSGAPFAASAWDKANKLANGRCVECYQKSIEADLKIADNKRAIGMARLWDAAATSPVEHCLAEIMLGRTLLNAGGGKKPNKAMMEEAHTALVKAEQISPAAYFYDGKALAELQQDAAAAAAFRAYAQKTSSTDPLLLRAQHFTLHPELAREEMVPAVVVTTLTGRHFNLDSMNGKVVLIDFWATWCGPCKEELPHMKKLAAQYAEEPFELISVSWDADETKWKDFIAANNMTWNQYRDTDHSLSKAFGINAIPHYFTIDANGVLTAENLGSGSDIDGRIKKLVKQAKEDRERIAATPAAPSPSGLQ